MTNQKQTKLDKVMSASKKTLVMVGVFSFFANLTMLAPTIYMLQVYDRVMMSRSVETLMFLTLIVLWMFVTMGVLEVVRSRMVNRLNARIDQELHEHLFSAVQKFALDHPGKDKPNPLGDLASIRQFLTAQGPFAFIDLPWVPVYIGVMTMFHWSYGVFALVSALILGGLALINDRSTKCDNNQANQSGGQATAEAEAQSRNAEVAHAMGMTDALRVRWSHLYNESQNAHFKAADKSGLWTIVSKTSRLALQSLILGLGAYLVINGHITAGMVMAGSFLLGRALAPLDQMIGSWKSFSMARSAYARIQKMLADMPEESKKMDLPPPEGNVSVKRLIATAPESKVPTLKGIEFSIKKGEMLGVIGSSGSGKSSLVRTLLGLWSVTSGEVRIDGTELKHWNLDDLGPYLGYLPQDVELFDGTVAENIARFEDVESDNVIAAARKAGVDELIRQLPDGYNTRIGKGGAALSGGQRQRIGLARACYGDPRVVVLDEPNSNLDEAGEAALFAACERLKKSGITLVVVTHRPSILRAADKLLVLEAGSQKVFGPAKAVFQHLAKEAEAAQKPKIVKRSAAA